MRIEEEADKKAKQLEQKIQELYKILIAEKERENQESLNRELKDRELESLTPEERKNHELIKAYWDEDLILLKAHNKKSLDESKNEIYRRQNLIQIIAELFRTNDLNISLDTVVSVFNNLKNKKTILYKVKLPDYFPKEKPIEQVMWSILHTHKWWKDNDTKEKIEQNSFKCGDIKTIEYTHNTLKITCNNYIINLICDQKDKQFTLKYGLGSLFYIFYIK